MIASLLTLSNPKTLKGEAFGYMTAILHLAPASLSGRNVCPWSSAGCRAACLNTAGRGAFSRIQQSRIRKTQEFTADPAAFTARLAGEIQRLKVRAAKRNLKLAVRLNGTSDLPWENIRTASGIGPVLMRLHPDVQFYDYTKSPMRMALWLSGRLPPNYHLTFSLSEENEEHARRIFATGGNIAIVGTAYAALSWAAGKGDVICGDDSDLRFLDPPHSVIYLKPKGKAKTDTSGFVRLG